MASILKVERKKRRQVMGIIAILATLVVLVLIISMNTGYIRLSPLAVIRTLFGGGTAKESLILFDLRLPRIIIAVLIGAALAVSGGVLQGISRNALADPGLLGINSGAGLMVVLFISFFSTHAAFSIFLLPFLALVGAGVTAALIYLLSYKKDEGILPTRMILVGVALTAVISSMMIILTLRLDPNDYKFVATWMAGSIWGSDWHFVSALLPWIIVLLPYIFVKARYLNALNLGDSIATGIGAAVEKERLKLLAASVGLAAASVSVSGGIGFVGLIGPHIARRLIGPNHKYLLPVAALCGSLLLVVADTLARWVLQPSEIPTGIVVAVIGAPYFLYLLAKSRA
ncbi:FecCD family ABC transporter permease [Pullulanibacillus camelliae]|nr:iron ABC transporter permease [Pullulanibacillus camelliae]